MSDLATIIERPDTHIQAAPISANSLMLDATSMDSMMRVADLMASGSATVPKHLQGNPADCMAVVMQSAQWRMNPFAVGQKTHLVNGTLGYEAQLVNAVITSMAPTKDRLHFDWFGSWEGVRKDDASVERGVRVWATLKGEDEPRELTISMAQVGTVRNSPLWTADPRQQIAYLAIKRWARLYTPDVILGVYTPDELEDVAPPAMRDMGAVEQVRQDTPAATSKTNSAKQRLAARRTPSQTVALKDVIDRIEQAETVEDMDEAANLAAQLQSDEDKQHARTAFAARKKALTHTTDAPTTTYDYPTLLSQIQRADSIEALDLIADGLRDIPEGDDRTKLDAAYQERRAALTGE